MPGRTLRIALAVGVCLAAANLASAELVFFSTGRTLSVKGHRDDGSSIVLNLRGGGQVTCPRSLVVAIAPDEVPIPDDVVAVAAFAATFPVPPEYQALIDGAASRHGVSSALVRAIIRVESAYQARALSRKGAMGLMQLMPDTARRFGVADPFDPAANIEGGIAYLKSLIERFGGDDVSLALAAYNAGEAAVQRFGGIPPYRETRNYVQAVKKLAGL